MSVVFLRVSRCFKLWCMAFQCCAAAGGASLTVEGPHSRSLGIFKDCESPAAEFTVVNSGDEPLRIIEILKTCGCNSATVDKERLEPGGKAIISVKIEPYTLDGPFSKSVFVITAPALKQQLSLTVTGESVPLFKIRPAKQINAGNLKNGEDWSGVFEITASTDSESKLCSAEFFTPGKVAVTSDCPADVTLLKEKDGLWKLPVHLTAPTNGKFRCEITLTVITPADRPPITFQVFGRAGTELIVIPETLIIAENKSSTQTVRIQTNGKRGRKLKPEELHITPHIEGLTFQAVPAREGGLTVSCKLSPSLIGGMVADTPLHITFSVPDAAPARLKITKIPADKPLLTVLP